MKRYYSNSEDGHDRRMPYSARRFTFTERRRSRAD